MSPPSYLPTDNLKDVVSICGTEKHIIAICTDSSIWRKNIFSPEDHWVCMNLGTMSLGEDESELKTDTISIENFKDTDGLYGMAYGFGFREKDISRIFQYGEFANMEIKVDENLNIVGGRIIPFDRTFDPLKADKLKDGERECEE